MAAVKRKADLLVQDVERSKTERAEFMERLVTFTHANWFAKPAVLSPVHCALNGWRNLGPDTIRCSTCLAQFSFAIRPNLQPVAVQRITQQFAEILRTGHQPACLWRRQSLPESIYYGETLSARDLFHRLQTCFQQLSEIDLPQLSNEAYAVLDGDKGSTWKRLFGEQKLSALVLILFGWSISATNPRCITCDLCCRVVGLWNFPTQGQSSLSPEQVVSESSLPLGSETLPNEDESDIHARALKAAALNVSKSMLTFLKAARGEPIQSNEELVASSAQFDVLAEHRWFCPCRLGQKSNWWTQNRQFLLDNAHLLRHEEAPTPPLTTKETLAKVRRLLSPNLEKFE